MRTPISRRVGPACFIDGWKVGAKKKAMLPVWSARSTTAGDAARFTPSCSNTSALPQRLDTDRNANLTSELQAAQVNLAEIQTRLQTLGSKLVYTDMVRSQLVNDTDNKPRLTIVRKSGGVVQKLNVDEDATLAPGDVIEVKLAIDTPPAMRPDPKPLR